MRRTHRREQAESKDSYRDRLRRLLEIDLNALEKEWSDHSPMVIDFCADLEEAHLDLRVAMSRLEVVKAELDKAARMDPEKFGIAKPSESAYKHAVLCHKKYLRYELAVFELKYEVGMLQGALKGMDHRKKGLSDLADLWAQGYWSRPSEPMSPTARDAIRRAKAEKAFNRNRRKNNERK